MSDALRSVVSPSARPVGFGSADMPPTPRVVAPRAIVMLWLAVIGLLIVGLICWSVRVPAPVDGIVVGTAGPTTLVAVPARACPHIAVGTSVVGDTGWTGEVQSIESAASDHRLSSASVPVTAVGPDPCLVRVRVRVQTSLPDGDAVADRARVEVQRTALSLWWDDTTTVMPASGEEAR